MEALARRLDVYLPMNLYVTDDNATAGVDGWNGEPYSDGGAIAEHPADAFERIDVITFGTDGAIESSQADIDLSRAIRRPCAPQSPRVRT